MKKDYLVLLNQLDGNLASDVSTRCSGRPQLFSRLNMITRVVLHRSTILRENDIIHYTIKLIHT